MAKPIEFEKDIPITGSGVKGVQTPEGIAGRDCPVGYSFLCIKKRLTTAVNQVKMRNLKPVTRTVDTTTARVWVLENPAATGTAKK